MRHEHATTSGENKWKKKEQTASVRVHYCSSSCIAEVYMATAAFKVVIFKNPFVFRPFEVITLKPHI